jgi:hypothetical protein
MDKFMQNSLWKTAGFTAVLGLLIGAFASGISGHGIATGAVLGLAAGGFIGLFGQGPK